MSDLKTGQNIQTLLTDNPKTTLDFIIIRHEDYPADADTSTMDYVIHESQLKRLNYSTMVKDSEYDPEQRNSIWVDDVEIELDWDTLKLEQYSGVYWLGSDDALIAINGADGADVDRFKYALLHEADRITQIEVVQTIIDDSGDKVGSEHIVCNIPVAMMPSAVDYSNIHAHTEASAPMICISTSYDYASGDDLDPDIHDLDDIEDVDIDDNLTDESYQILNHDLDIMDIEDVLNTTENQYAVYDSHSDW